MYAVFEDSGQQFRVSEGDVVEVDLREVAEGASEIEFDRVLLIGSESDIKVGTPLVPGAKVVAEVLKARAKGPKVHHYYWRRRKGSQKKIGHRQKYVQVRVAKIEA